MTVHCTLPGALKTARVSCSLKLEVHCSDNQACRLSCMADALAYWRALIFYPESDIDINKLRQAPMPFGSVAKEYHMTFGTPLRHLIPHALATSMAIARTADTLSKLAPLRLQLARCHPTCVGVSIVIKAEMNAYEVSRSERTPNSPYIRPYATFFVNHAERGHDQ